MTGVVDATRAVIDLDGVAVPYRVCPAPDGNWDVHVGGMLISAVPHPARAEEAVRSFLLAERNRITAPDPDPEELEADREDLLAALREQQRTVEREYDDWQDAQEEADACETAYIVAEQEFNAIRDQVADWYRMAGAGPELLHRLRNLGWADAILEEIREVRWSDPLPEGLEAGDNDAR